MKTIIGLKQDGPYRGRQYDVWRLTFDGSVLGDSRGYSRNKAIREAIAQVAVDPNHYELEHGILYPAEFWLTQT